MSLKAKEDQLQSNKLLLAQKDQLLNILSSNVEDLKNDKAELKQKVQHLESAQLIGDSIFNENIPQEPSQIQAIEPSGDNSIFEEM